MKIRKKQLWVITTIFFFILLQDVKAASSSSLAFSEGTQLVWRVNKTTTTNGTEVEENTNYHLLNISKIVEDAITVNVTFNSLMSNETITETNINDANWTESDFGFPTGTGLHIFNRSIDAGEIFPYFCLLDSNLSEIQTFNETTVLNFLSDIAMKLSPEFFIYLFVMSFSTFFSDYSELTNSSQIITNTETKLVGSIAYNSSAYSSGTNAWTNITLKTKMDFNFDPVSKVLLSGNIETVTNMTNWNETLAKYVSTDYLVITDYQLIAPKSLSSTPTTTTTSTTTTSTEETTTSTSTNSSTDPSSTEEDSTQGFLDTIPGYEQYFFVGFSIVGILFTMKTKKCK